MVGSWDSQRFSILLSQSLVTDINVGIMYQSPDLLVMSEKRGWGTFDLSEKTNVQRLSDHMRLFARDYFAHPQFWKVNGKPIIMYYESRLFSGDVPNTIGRLRDIAQDYGFKPFIIGDEAHWYTSPNWSPDWLKSYDAITRYVLHANENANVTDGNYEAKLESHFSSWSKRGKFIPFAIPSFEHIDEESAKADPRATIQRSATKFAERIKIAKRHVNPDLDVLMISTFNDWFDNSQVEPTKEEGFTFLNTVAENL